MEAPPRFELGIEALQAPALPLGDGATLVILIIYVFILVVPGAGLEPAQYCYRGILSPLRLPISPSGHKRKDKYITIIMIINNTTTNGAGNEVRTRDPNLGKVMLYH